MKKLSYVLFGKFWDMVKMGDTARMAKQPYPKGITESNNHAYITDGNIHHLLDVYSPRGTTEKLPVIIDIHGGGWMYGDKELNKRYCMELSSRGFTVFNLSYRLCPQVTMWEQLQDIFAAFSWIDAHLSDFPAHRERVFVTGDSAGGQLCAYCAAINGKAELMERFSLAPNSLQFKAAGLVSPVAFMEGGIVGVYTSRMLGKDYLSKPTSPYGNFDRLLADAKTMPPTTIVTSSGDFIARTQTHRIYDCITAQGGIKVTLKDWEKTDGKSLPHVFSVVEPFNRAGRECIDEMTAFFLSNAQPMDA